MRAIRNIARIRLPIATLITMAGNNHGTDLIVEVGNAKSNGLPVLETLLLPQRTGRLLPERRPTAQEVWPGSSRTPLYVLPFMCYLNYAQL